VYVRLQSSGRLWLSDRDHRYSTRPRTACAVSSFGTKPARFARRQGLQITTAGNFYATALHVVARNGHAEVVRLLLQEGADINTEDEERETTLNRAVSRRGEVRAKLGQESPHTKGLEAVVRLLRNVEGSRTRA
jgi:Ankyrin repeats (many copies)